MKFCDLTFPLPEQNLACDEALLDLAEEGCGEEVLRVWEPAQYFVVVGYGNKIATEVNADFCQTHDLPIHRRCTGGGTVLQGPGVLNYSLILAAEPAGPLASIAGANRFIMERHRSALGGITGHAVEIRGHTDLAIAGLKFCGNAQRRRKTYLLFHGSFLVHADLEMIAKALPQPSHQPDYRAGRSHSEFLMNLNLDTALIKTRLAEAWHAEEPLNDIPSDRIDSLVRRKYSRPDWNFRF